MNCYSITLSRFKISFHPKIRFNKFALQDLTPMASGSGKDDGGKEDGREQDKHKLLPIASMGRMMKKALPNNAKISQEAKETMQKCTAEFISIVTKEAARKCQEELRKTVRGDDLVWAMSHMGFEEYVEPIKGYLQKYKEMENMEKGDAGGVGPSDIIH